MHRVTLATYESTLVILKNFAKKLIKDGYLTEEEGYVEDLLYGEIDYEAPKIGIEAAPYEDDVEILKELIGEELDVSKISLCTYVNFGFSEMGAYLYT